MDPHARGSRNPDPPGQREQSSEVYRLPDRTWSGHGHDLDRNTVSYPCAAALFEQRARSRVLHLRPLLRPGESRDSDSPGEANASLQSWGVAIGGTILQNSLRKKLPAAFDAQFPSGVQIAYAAIPRIRSLDPQLQILVRDAFASSLQLLWKVMIGIAGAGLLSVLLMKELTMRTDLDEQWGMQERKVDTSDAERRVVS